MKPLILGEGYSKIVGSSYGKHPLSGQIAFRIAKTLGFMPKFHSKFNKDTQAYRFLRDRFELDNLFLRYPGKVWPMADARAQVARVPKTFVMVMLGQRLARTFGLCLPYHFWTIMAHRGNAVQTVIVPHPSGLNRIYNDANEWRKLGTTLQDAIERAKGLKGLESIG